MPPRPKTDSGAEVAALVKRLAINTRGQPVTVAQVCRMLETDTGLRAAYDQYHATWSRLDTTLAHSELAVTDALRRLEGYSDGDYSCRRLQERRPGGRVDWIFAHALSEARQPITIEHVRTTSLDQLKRIADALERLATAAEHANTLD